jgi:hypothetical protein
MPYKSYLVRGTIGESLEEEEEVMAQVARRCKRGTILGPYRNHIGTI